MKSFKADYVYPVCADPIKNGIVTVDDSGRIVSVTDPGTSSEPDNIPVKKLSGIICPGFVNTHCHLELSHLKGKIEPRKGLVNFIKEIQKTRKADNAEILDAAAEADSAMYENGIVAVGDIVNTNITIPVKARSSLYYHSFIESFGFVPAQAKEVFERALNLLNEFKPSPCSITPHAPYSVSKELFKLIKNYSEDRPNLISIHNQESEEENKFYRYKLGDFNDLYADFGIDISHFKPQARNSLQSMIPLLTNKQKILLVHNTFTNLKDIYFLKRFDRDIHWCFCPNANLYIEDIVPKVELFLGQGYNITLGTDSLASNNELSILGEMCGLQQKYPVLTTTQLIEWASLNGAKYFDIADEKGSLQAGMTPGLNLITGLDGLRLTPESKVKRLV
ncbi:MAG TPA: amidohydrolase family protein [Mucilaginibacter sp.]|jgi:cytosine/adenosine deaminase-related metal-dependent hydrolase|nr:amidohydrolase family protein [Mucilaginibacter sp.]